MRSARFGRGRFGLGTMLVGVSMRRIRLVFVFGRIRVGGRSGLC